MSPSPLFKNRGALSRKKSGAGPVPPDDGVVTYVHDYTAARGQANAPDYGWNWGVQYGGVLGGQGPANFVSIVPDGIKPGVPSLKITVSADTGNDAVEGLYQWPHVMGGHWFHGMNIKFPTNWVEPGSAGWGACINQLGYQGLVNSTQALIAHSDRCMYMIAAGEQRWPDMSKPGQGNPIREFENLIGPWPQYPVVIDPPMALGVWHQLIFEIVWSTCSTASAHFADIGSVSGLIRIWHKLMSQSPAEWVLKYEKLNIPTMQWGYGYDWDASGPNPPAYWSYNQVGASQAHKFGLYSSQATFNRVIEHGKIVFGTTFGAVANAMP